MCTVYDVAVGRAPPPTSLSQALGEAGEMSGTTATVCFLEPCDGALAGEWSCAMSSSRL